MIARTTRAKKGISDYLLKGEKKDSKYTRNEKDKVTTFYGDLDIFKETEKYLNKYKNYTDNYLHITISFSKEDMIKMENMTDSEVSSMKRDIVEKYIKHHTSGYNTDNEVIAYAEEHSPKIKIDENGKERLNHIHISIALYNPLDDTKLQTTFHNNSFIDDTLQAYINNKYELSHPRDNKRDIRRDIEYISNNGLLKKEWTAKLKHLKDSNELIFELENTYKFKKDIDYKVAGSENFKYIKLINKGKNKNGLCDINLNNKELPHLMILNNRDFRANKDKSIDELKNILTDYYNQRKAQISKRKSKKNTQLIQKYYDPILESKVLKRSGILAGIASSLRVVRDVQKAVKPRHKKAVNTQAQRILEKQNQQSKTLSFTAADAIKNETKERPKTTAQSLLIEERDKEQKDISDKKIYYKLLKQNLKAQRVLDFAVSKYQLNANNYTITNDNKIDNLNNKQKPKNVIDFIQNELNLSSREAIEICQKLYDEQALNIEVSKDNLVGENKMSLKISICKDTNINSLEKWEQIEVKSYSELATTMKQFPYSQSVYDNSYRNADNAKSFNNVLIYDIDNDKDTPQLTINQAKELLKQHNISAMILPSKSHLKDKNGHITERYRIVIPTQQSIDNLIDKDTYREFQKITSRALKIDKYVDRKALNDKARFYYKSHISAELTIIKSDRVMNIKNLLNKAKENIAEQQRQREAEQQKVSEMRANLSQYVETKREQSNNLTYANVDKIMSLDIKQLINYFEKQSETYKDGSYEMIKTANAKYSIVAHNVAHDFKNDITHNSLTYLQHKMNTTNLNSVARELEKITGESFVELNKDALERAIENALERAWNDKTFENELKKYFNVDYVNFKKEELIIADQKIRYEELRRSKSEIVEELRRNREREQEQDQGMSL